MSCGTENSQRVVVVTKEVLQLWLYIHFVIYGQDIYGIMRVHPLPFPKLQCCLFNSTATEDHSTQPPFIKHLQANCIDIQPSKTYRIMYTNPHQAQENRLMRGKGLLPIERLFYDWYGVKHLTSVTILSLCRNSGDQK